MNIALIFAAGTGQRMNSKSKPKQFLDVHGKPIIIHTLEKFQESPEIDEIVVVCLERYISYMKELAEFYHLSKIKDVVAGGQTGQGSIYNGLVAISHFASDNDVVLIHDGVRPFVDNDTISKNIECVHKNGNAITVSGSVETIITIDENNMVSAVQDRSKCMRARAPQSFFFKDIFSAHKAALAENKYDFIDSATLMRSFGHKLYTVEGLDENIKITTKMDFFMFKGVLDAKEIEQIYID